MTSEDADSSRAVATAVRTLPLEEAVTIAKQWLATTLAQEQVKNIGLEEFTHQDGHWSITLGFSRSWDNVHNAISVLSGEVFLRRAYKILTVDEKTGAVLSMRNRD